MVVISIFLLSGCGDNEDRAQIGSPCDFKKRCAEGLACIDGICVTDPCIGVSCSGYGYCTIANEEAFCICEAGYRDVGLNCVPVDSTNVECDPNDPCTILRCFGDYCYCDTHDDYGNLICPDAICQEGESRNCANECGNIGTRYCVQGQWTNCEALPCASICEPGQAQEVGCGRCGRKIRICQNDETWGEYSVCNEPECCTGDTDTRDCNDCGTQNRSCTASNTWGVWTSCQGTRTCPEGICQSNGTCSSSDPNCVDSDPMSGGSCCTEGITANQQYCDDYLQYWTVHIVCRDGKWTSEHMPSSSNCNSPGRCEEGQTAFCDDSTGCGCK